HSKAVVVKDMDESIRLASYIRGEKNSEEFYREFKGKFSEGFDLEKDLIRVGVINQTTMLATETSEIAEFFKNQMILKYGEENLKNHFADTRDTLCYATNENQDATLAFNNTDADLAFVVGGYNSSNTSHLVELLEHKFPTFFISGPDEIKSQKLIHHFNYPKSILEKTENYLPVKEKIKVILTSGASCPDSIVEAVMRKIISYFNNVKQEQEVLDEILMSN
ncbi:MAG: 4-hydroxy-3-methylbut-2-enyl diphosphate reductase, partial [Bacteroidota bacterium]